MPDPSDSKYNRGLLSALCFAMDFERETGGTFSEGLNAWSEFRDRMSPSNVIYLAHFLGERDDE
jgi:hypothetical protein